MLHFVGLAPIHMARLKLLKLKVPMLAVYRVGLLFVFRKFWMKHFSHVWHCSSNNFVLLLLKTNEKSFFPWEALACFGDWSRDWAQ